MQMFPTQAPCVHGFPVVQHCLPIVPHGPLTACATDGAMMLYTTGDAMMMPAATAVLLSMRRRE